MSTKNYLQHYGVKGMRWRQHIRRREQNVTGPGLGVDIHDPQDVDGGVGNGAPPTIKKNNHGFRRREQNITGEGLGVHRRKEDSSKKPTGDSRRGRQVVDGLKKKKLRENIRFAQHGRRLVSHLLKRLRRG